MAFATETKTGLGRTPTGKSGAVTAIDIVSQSGPDSSVSVRDQVPACAKHHVHPRPATV